MKPIYQCFTASPTDSLKSALDRLEQENIQAMPVVENEIFKGMISKQIIYKAYFYSSWSQGEFLQNKNVGEVISNEDLFVDEDQVFETTLTAFKEFPILAVVDKNRKFLGIISRFDVLAQFESAFGLKRKGIRIAFSSEEATGRFSRLSDIIKQLDMNIISIATFDETDKLARRIVLKIEQGGNVEKLAKKLTKSGFRVLDIKEF
ncbi:CBS domain-containing protein [Aquibacillus kalidii]|uniref:CBS domain-containing protein n=1 Tax=Aquibacillus kalidii TaxID=2762597 RepID=UPI001F3C5DA0|nr:CBS domain-containing protein [Aquibacillus kalidii]